MNALILESSDTQLGSRLSRVSLAGQSGYDEKWLQGLLFNNPDLIPLDRIGAGAGSLIPLAREFALPRDGGNVFLDLLGVTPAGRLVLVECKLWRNPQARREVIAQIMEYAALLRGWSYGDLTARFRTLSGLPGPNPLYEHARSFAPDLEEVQFVEGVSESLSSAEFQLIIAGDGIRSDLQVVTSHLNSFGTSAARLSLLEIQLWRDGVGRIVVVPTVPLRTEVIEQRVIVAADGRPIQVDSSNTRTDVDAVEQAISDPDRADQRRHNREFWQRFIDEINFDNPDQQQPRHGGNNWVRIDMPPPATWLTAYRTANQIGLFLTLKGNDGANLFDAWSGQKGELEKECGLELRFEASPSEGTFKGTIATSLLISAQFPAEEQHQWIKDAANRLVNLFRPRLSQWNAAEHSGIKR
jgi:hypothetical protein